MQNSIQMPDDIRKLPSGHSQKLQWLREQAASIRMDLESGKITSNAAEKKLNSLVEDGRGFVDRLFKL